MIDIGGTVAYWAHVPKELFARYACEVPIVNLDGPPSDGVAPPRRVQQGDGCAPPFADNAFDIAHSTP
ncbi:hypothetical protein [Xanthomonas maliensis]|uniref:hypothetical protein n=1 Tax=Xanthomonas maliensis TaxID=1321368 RepID=UPI001264BF19|nr:hypothetical protein [Xanthomonas maliensis]KAB7768827.1 hypothetical protein CKY51_08680 [Xanthomonas maliensis]